MSCQYVPSPELQCFSNSYFVPTLVLDQQILREHLLSSRTGTSDLLDSFADPPNNFGGSTTQRRGN